MGKELNKALWYGASALTTVFTVGYGVDAIVYNGQCQNPSDLKTSTKNGIITFDVSPGCEYLTDNESLKNELAEKLGVGDYIPSTIDNKQPLPSYDVSKGYAAIEFKTTSGNKLMAVPPDLLMETTLNNTTMVPKKDILRGNMSILLGSIFATTISSVIALISSGRRIKYSSHKPDSGHQEVDKNDSTNNGNEYDHRQKSDDCHGQRIDVIIPDAINQVDQFSVFINNLMRKYPTKHKNRRRTR